MKALTKKELGSKITKLANREKVTKQLLGELSRELLTYVYESKDIATLNRLLGVLTPINKKVAIAFFSVFVGWTFDTELSQFGKQQKEKPHTKKAYLADTFLADEANNIWVWADTEIEIAPKAKNYGMKISKLVDKALTDEAEGIDLREVLYAIMSSDAVSLGDLMKSLKDVAQVEVAA